MPCISLIRGEGAPGSPAWVTNEDIINSNYLKGVRHPARTTFLNRCPATPCWTASTVLLRMNGSWGRIRSPASGPVSKASASVKDGIAIASGYKEKFAAGATSLPMSQRAR